jgi:hypothetical protein
VFFLFFFYYEVVNKLWPDNEIVFGDTDSLVLSIKTKDVYEDLKEIRDEMDTCDFTNK